MVTLYSVVNSTITTSSHFLTCDFFPQVVFIINRNLINIIVSLFSFFWRSISRVGVADLRLRTFLKTSITIANLPIDASGTMP